MVELGEGEQLYFLLTPSRTNVENVVDLGITHVHAIGPLVKWKSMFDMHVSLTDKVFISLYKTKLVFWNYML